MDERALDSAMGLRRWCRIQIDRVFLVRVSPFTGIERPLCGHCTAIVQRLVLSLGSALLSVPRQSMGWLECSLFEKADEILRQHPGQGR